MRVIFIKLPGFMACGSLSQRVRFSCVGVIMHPAKQARLAKWVRLGPVTPAALVPLIVWQPMHMFAGSRRFLSPALPVNPGGGSTGGLLTGQAMLENSAETGRSTRKSMLACCVPQNSAHCPS